jgi:hypothetical protein
MLKPAALKSLETADEFEDKSAEDASTDDELFVELSLDKSVEFVDDKVELSADDEFEFESGALVELLAFESVLGALVVVVRASENEIDVIPDQKASPSIVTLAPPIKEPTLGVIDVITGSNFIMKESSCKAYP